MPRSMRTRPVSAVQTRAYANKAAEYAEAAASELVATRYIAATSLAIHAAINAADAVCGARLGQRAAGEDHDQALILLQTTGPDGAKLLKDLRRILPLKTKTEYEPDDIAPGVAEKAVERAQRHTLGTTWPPKQTSRVWGSAWTAPRTQSKMSAPTSPTKSANSEPTWVRSEPT